MRDDPVSEEKLIEELNRMYLRIADLETPKAQTRQHPDDCVQNSDQKVKAHEKIIPFPLPRTHITSREASEDKLKQKRKPWYRSYLMLPFPVIVLLITCLMILSQLTGGPRNPEKIQDHPQTFSMPAGGMAPTQTEDPGRVIEEREQEVEMQPDPSAEAVIPLPRKRHYTVQVGAFESWEITCNLLEELREKGLECHWAEIKTKDSGPLYRVFSGYFVNSNEANEFIRKHGIFKDYPDSFVREVPSNEGEVN